MEAHMSQLNMNESNTWSKAVQLTGESLSDALTVSTPVACNDHGSHNITTTLLSSDRILVCYTNDTDSGHLYSLVLTVDGTTITASTPVQCNSHRSDFISTVLLSTDKVLVCYRNDTNSYYLYSLVLTISGTTITASTPVQCNTHRSYYISTVLLSTDKVLVCYQNNTNSSYLYSLVLTISGTTITASTPVQCNSHYSTYITTVLLSTDKVLVCYGNQTDSGHLYSLVLTV